MRHSFNDIFKKQNQKLIRASFKKGFIVSVNPSVSTADVYFAENPNTIIKNIPLSNSVDASLLMPGSRCRVDVFDETNPNDMVIAYTYGSVASTQGTIFGSGTGSISNGGSNDIAIAHGLKDSNGVGVVPDIWLVLANPAAIYYAVTGRYYVLINVSADDTYLNATRLPDNVISVNYLWFAIKF